MPREVTGVIIFARNFSQHQFRHKYFLVSFLPFFGGISSFYHMCLQLPNIEKFGGAGTTSQLLWLIIIVRTKCRKKIRKNRFSVSVIDFLARFFSYSRHFWFHSVFDIKKRCVPGCESGNIENNSPKGNRSESIIIQRGGETEEAIMKGKRRRRKPLIMI